MGKNYDKEYLVCVLVSTICYGSNNGWSEKEAIARAIAASLGQVYIDPDAALAVRLQREEQEEVARRVEEQRLEAQRQGALMEAQRVAEQQRREELRVLRTGLRDVARDHARTIQEIAAQGADVHVLDKYIEVQLPEFVAQVRKALPHLVAAEAPYFADMDRLRYDIWLFVPDLFSYRNPEGIIKEISREGVNQYVSDVLNTASVNHEVFSLYSLHMAMVLDLEKNGHDIRANMLEFINAICENYETQGGCSQGVRNRGFIRLVDLIVRHPFFFSR